MPQLHKCYCSAQKCQMCMRFLETLVIFSKYIQLLVVTWKTLRSREEKEDHWTGSWQGVQLCKHGLPGWSCSFKALVGHSTVCSFWFMSPTLWACPGFALLMALSAQECVPILSGICVAPVSVMGQHLCAHTAAFSPAGKGFCFAKCRARAVSLPPNGTLKRAVSSQKGRKRFSLLCAVRSSLLCIAMWTLHPVFPAQLSSGAVKPGRRKINKAICLHVLQIHHILFIAYNSSHPNVPKVSKWKTQQLLMQNDKSRVMVLYTTHKWSLKALFTFSKAVCTRPYPLWCMRNLVVKQFSCVTKLKTLLKT